MWYPLVLALLAGYFLGNLNGAVTMSLCQGREDVRKKGSGNAGLTNYFRNYGGGSTLLVLAIDVGKTVLSCLLGGLLLKPYDLSRFGTMAAGLAVILGHNFPALLGFRGGKGIICSAAVAAMVSWKLFVLIVAGFLLTYALTKYVSLGSCVAAVIFIGASWVLFWGDPLMAVLGTAMGALALLMHRENLYRLCKGTERKTYLRRKQ